MKNALILALVALLLFSVSATMSLWLNQPAPTSDPAPPLAKTPTRKGGKDKVIHEDPEREVEIARPVIRPKANAATQDLDHLTSQMSEQMAAVKERESRLEKRQAHLDLILQDIRAERQSIDSARKQAGTEVKHLTEKIAELDRKATDLEQQRQAVPKSGADAKRSTDQDDERKNFDRIAPMTDNMSPENAARILQQFADMGKLDLAARLLSQMKERQAAKVLDQVSDPALAAQLLDKMRSMKRGTALPPTATKQ